VEMRPGRVFHIQRFSLHDGPGIRTTVFLKGCPLRCRWCHNPESQSAEPEIRTIASRCMHCGACIEHCPRSGVEARLPGASACLRCGACVAACPTGARSFAGHPRTVPEVMRELLGDRPFYDESQGGVTFSGGEPLMQPDFLLALLRACQDEQLHSAVDTCGDAPPETLLAVAALANLILYDVKVMDRRLHRDVTGVTNDRILSNLRLLGEQPTSLWIRVPLIPEVNCDAASLSAIADFVTTIRSVKQVNLLPYHDLGTHKQQAAPNTAWRSTPGAELAGSAGDSHRSATASVSERVGVPPELLERAQRIFRSAGLKTVMGG
jgi:pyruvate formate lyase activating enzyme